MIMGMKHYTILVVFVCFCFCSCNFSSTTNETSIDDSECDNEPFSIEYSSENDDVTSNEDLEFQQPKLSFFDNAKSKFRSINLFSIDDDVALGKQVFDEIILDDSYPILSRNQYKNVYEYWESIRDNILQSSHIQYKDDFEWTITIIDDDVLNAFVTPGGYIFFFTGLLKYVKSEAELASILGHEIAHADRRHCTETMTKEYGLSFLLSILIGDNSFLSSIVQTLAFSGADLAFSRKHEYETDEFSVRYLTDIQDSRFYYPIALTDFFDRMQADSLSKSQGKFEFLRTHPYDDNRKQKMYKIWESLGSPKGNKFENTYTAMIKKLP